MTTARDTLNAELTAHIATLDEQGLTLFGAMVFASKHDPEKAELWVLIEALDPAPLIVWLRANGWLDVDSVLKPGPVYRYALLDDAKAQTRRTAQARMLDILLPDRQRLTLN